MKGLIRASLANPYAVIVMVLTVAILGSLTLIQKKVPIDILPVFKSPAVQVLTFYGGMPAQGMEKDITNRMERWTGQANGMKRLESRSILGASIVRNYFQDDQDPNGALTQVNSLALGVIPNLPPGTLPPVVLPFDPTSVTPVALVALDSPTPDMEAILYDVARYEVRNYIMQNPGATAPVVIGGKIRAVMLYLDETKMQSLGLSAADVMTAVDRYNIFFPSGDVKLGDKDYAVSSNSMFDLVERFKEIPVKVEPGKITFLGAIATPKDSSFIQTNVVRVNGRRQVYIPVYRQIGASTLDVVDTLKEKKAEMESKLKQGDIKLEVVMDQSVYVRASIHALVQEGLIGSILCSLVILIFLGQWRMTVIAISTLPLSVLAALLCLNAVGQTINVMTLAGLTLAIGPMIDSAIICLENTHRHLTMGASPRQAALDGASEVAMPELVSTLCTFLVLSPLALMPGMGKFLFLPMALAVMFAMIAAYLLSRTLVPCASAFLLSHHGGGHEGAAGHGGTPHPEGAPAVERRGLIGRAFARWEKLIDRGIAQYVRALDVVLRHRVKTVVIGFTLLVVTIVGLYPFMRRDFFPEMDSGAFEIAARAPSGTRIENTEKLVEKVENAVRKFVPKEDLKLIVSEIGLTADWSAAYTANSGPMDAVLKIQLEPERRRTSQEYIRILREQFKKNPEFATLEFSFDSGGLVRGALNEGKSSPINIQLVGNDQDTLFGMADKIKKAVQKVDGVVDARVLQRPDAPQLTINVDRARAADQGLNQDEIMKNVIAAMNSSITYNKRNFWIDPKSNNQYFVGVQYPEVRFQNRDDILDLTITSPKTGETIPLRNVLDPSNPLIESTIPTEIHHVNLQPAIDLTMNVEGRDLGHVSDDITAVLTPFGRRNADGTWSPYDPKFDAPNRQFKVIHYGDKAVHPDADGIWSPYDPYFDKRKANFKIVSRGGKEVARWTDGTGRPGEAEVVRKGGKRLAQWTDDKGAAREIEIVTDHRGKDRVLMQGVKTFASWTEDNGGLREVEILPKLGKRIARWTDDNGKIQEIEIVTDHRGKDRVLLRGSKIILAGEYTRMQDTFHNLGMGLILASLLIYFLMVALDKSFIVPLTVMSIVPLCLIGILPMLFVTGSAINVQSLLGFIFIVGIKVANSVLMTDYAQELRRHEGLTPIQAIRKAASLRVRPITMTALAAFFAMVPTALALEHGSEANAPLARAILGGLLAGEPATLFVLPCVYTLLVRDKKGALPPETMGHGMYEAEHDAEQLGEQDGMVS